MVQQFASPLAETPCARDYIDIMCEIRKIGIFQEFEEKTPTIVVFGDQSSGKSSVLQRLTGGLPVPRGANKCTSTPFEIRMLETENASRTISLRFVEDRNRRDISPKEVEFANITYSSKKEIEEKLKEAQRYVQNPGVFLQSQSELDGLRLPIEDELSFTRNAVCVTISGPDQMYSLSMVDLPGIVRNHEEHETFVMDLVKEYIKKDSAILVPIFSATQDIATQCAWRLARGADPQGLRTVGVLTKMDKTITDDVDKHQELAFLVKGTGEHQLRNGTYVVRNPSTGDRSGRSEANDDANRLEQETINQLKSIRPWKDVPPDRYGLPNLTMKLSELQGDAHERTWPLIRPLLESRRNEIADRLRKLPPEPTGNPIIRFLALVGIYDKTFTQHANAEHTDHKLYNGQQWNFGQFDQALLHTRPRYKLAFDNGLINDDFDPIRPGSLQCRVWSDKLRELIKSDDWGEQYKDEEKYTWDSDQLCEVVQSSQGGQIVGYFPYKSVVEIVKVHQDRWLSISTTLLDKNFGWVKTFNDDLVDKTFQEFPNAVEEIKKILTVLLKECKEETLKHLQDLEEMEHISASRALYVTDEASVLKKQSKYFTKIRILSAERNGSVSKRILKKAKKLHGLMYDGSSNQENQENQENREYFESKKAKLIECLFEERNNNNNDATDKLIEEIRSMKYGTGNMPSTATRSMMLAIKNSYLDKMVGFSLKTNEDNVNQSILKSTISEHAFLGATGALAYWKMAHTKFREIVPRIVEFYLVHQFARRLGMYLRAYFKLLGPEVEKSLPNQDNNINLKELLGENPEIAKNRKEWSGQIEAIEAVLEKVQKASVKIRTRGYGGGGGGGGGGSSRRRGGGDKYI